MRLISCLAAALLVAAGPYEKEPLPATSKKIDFTVSVVPADPFADGNGVNAPPAKEYRRGDVVTVRIAGRVGPGLHTYPLAQRSASPDQETAPTSLLTFTPSPGLKPLQPISETEPQSVFEKKNSAFVLEHVKPFVWSFDVLIAPDAKPGEHTLAFAVDLTVCNESNCVPGRHRFEVPFRVSDEAPLAVAPELAAREMSTNGPPTVAATVTEPKAVTPPPTETTTTSPPPTPDGSAVGFVQQLALAAAAGFAMLLTPCVFPMIPITVSFFLKQGESKHTNPVLLAVVYSGTIIFVLTAAVLLLGNLIISFANNRWFNLGMGLVLIFFALSLFGMFEIELPHFLTRFTSSREGQGGLIGAFFMALTFTINSFTCTGPFLGPLLSSVKELKLSSSEVAVSAVVYSSAFAAPFFVLALFPSLIKSLPKSGGWLNATKVVMGFIEIGLALKFLAITDSGFFPGNPRFFNYDTVLCTCMALSVACGLYLLGFYRLPHDTPLNNVGVPRMLLATFFLGLSVYMAPLLWRKPPQGAVGEFLNAWLPQDNAPTPSETASASSGATKSAAELSWTRDYEKAWEQARQEHKLLLVDFTGVNCQNCRYNEKNVFPRAEVAAEFARFVRLQLYTDQIPDRTLTADQSYQKAQEHQKWQQETFQDVSLPLYAVLDPSTADKPFTSDGRMAGTIKGRASGTIDDVGGFVTMLKRAQGK